jgi:hypothetical protein
MGDDLHINKQTNIFIANHRWSVTPLSEGKMVINE